MNNTESKGEALDLNKLEALARNTQIGGTPMQAMRLMRDFQAAANPAAILELIALARSSLSANAGEQEPVATVEENDEDVSVINAVLPIGTKLYLAAPAATAAPVKLVTLESALAALEFLEQSNADGRKAEARAMLAAAPTTQHVSAAPAGAGEVDAWISVQDRLPEDCQEVLVLCPDTGCEPSIWSALWLSGSKTFESNSNGWADLDDISHWMPRPATPEQSAIAAQPKDTTDTRRDA